MQNLSSVLPRLGPARHVAVPESLCTRCVQQKLEKPLLLVTAVPFLPPSEHKEACSCITSLEAGIGAQLLQLASHWGRVLVPGSCCGWV